MKLCLYQGTFNPPHLGHLKVAEFVMEKLNFDKILFIPAAKPPHKTLQEDNSLHRLNMTKLLVKNHPKFIVSDIEFQRQTPSYTFVTLQELYRIMDLKEKPSFIIGDDAFIKIESWYHSDELKNLINFVVLPRDEDFDENIFDKIAQKGYNYTRLNMPKIQISSTEIRKMASEKMSLKDYTTQEVEKYIYENNLYKNVH